jgi:hypothetical protein
MKEQSKDQCAHPTCNCKAASDSKYCSGYCEAAKDKTEISCGCEHANCGGKAS